MSQGANPNYKLIAGVVLAIVCLALYGYMKGHGMDTTELFIFVGPLVTYLLIGSKVEAETQKQNQVLAKIDEQTNGVLEGKIRRITSEVVHEGLRKQTAELQSDKQDRLF